MSNSITVPAGTARYALTRDLTTMANVITGHLDKIQGIAESKVSPNTNVGFLSVSADSVFTPQLFVTGARPNTRITNDANGFGLRDGSVYFLSDGAQWLSNSHIVVPEGGTGNQAITRNALNSINSTLTAALTALTARVNAIESDYAKPSQITNATTPLASRIASLEASVANIPNQLNTKANAWNDLNRVNVSNYADSAGSADRANRAGNADTWAGRSLRVGTFYAGKIDGGGTGAGTIHHHLGYVPIVLAQAYNDDGVSSISCSIGSIDTSSAVIKYKNHNASTAETCSVNWMAF